ncbi:MAG: GNAT family N-acetyltransferase [Oscillospiraceae bacterium]|nr:GNAT family N-acetyltransferase [Oscillospiraceae bacterium]MBQ9930456.1 GNAT family N-acetyltransferase [Oscillospiraceae bacterium]
MQIRNATKNDIPGILHLLKQVGKVHSDLRPDIFPAGTLKYDEAALLQLLKDTSRPIFIAELDGEVAGYCFCVHKVIGDTSVSVGRQELYIDDLCVDENHRRMGLAKALYHHALAYAKSLGCTALNLNVWCGNDGAMRFYQQMGMRPRNIMLEVPLEE